MTTSNLDFPSNFYVQRITPDYSEEIVDICFESEMQFQAWFDTVVIHHANWAIRTTHISEANLRTVESFDNNNRNMIKLAKETTYFVCDHGGKYKKKAISVEVPTPKKQRKTRDSIKVGCLAKFTKIIFFNGEVEVKYAWKHINHDPLAVSDIVSSRLPASIKLWIRKQVDSNMDWKAIKACLRMTEQSLDNVSYIYSIFFNILIHTLYSLICQALSLEFLLV